MELTGLWDLFDELMQEEAINDCYVGISSSINQGQAAFIYDPPAGLPCLVACVIYALTGDASFYEDNRLSLPDDITVFSEEALRWASNHLR